MPEALVVERSATLFNLLSRTLESAQVPISKHFERFGDAVDELRERISNAQLPDLLIIGIPEKEPTECEALLKLIKELPPESLPILLLSLNWIAGLPRAAVRCGFCGRSFGSFRGRSTSLRRR
jgi:hypothetical protein